MYIIGTYTPYIRSCDAARANTEQLSEAKILGKQEKAMPKTELVYKLTAMQPNYIPNKSQQNLLTQSIL